MRSRAYTFPKSQFSQTMRMARSARKLDPGSEICGLIVDTGFQLLLTPVRNTSRRPGSFILSVMDVRRIVNAADVLGQQVVGTFHSHPVGLAVPGRSDIANAVNDSLMLIFDCMGKEGRLWRIRRGRAKELRFVLANPPGGS